MEINLSSIAGFEKAVAFLGEEFGDAPIQQWLFVGLNVPRCRRT